MRANAGTWLTLVIDLGRRGALVVHVLARAGWLAGWLTWPWTPQKRGWFNCYLHACAVGMALTWADVGFFWP